MLSIELFCVHVCACVCVSVYVHMSTRYEDIMHCMCVFVQSVVMCINVCVCLCSAVCVFVCVTKVVQFNILPSSYIILAT